MIPARRPFGARPMSAKALDGEVPAPAHDGSRCNVVWRRRDEMTIPALRTVPLPSRNPAIVRDHLKKPLTLCAIALLGAAAACSGTIETQETEPSARQGASNNPGTGTNT